MGRRQRHRADHDRGREHIPFRAPNAVVDAQGQTRVRNASRAVAPYKRLCAADFQDDSALLIFVEGSPSQHTTKNRQIYLYT